MRFGQEGAAKGTRCRPFFRFSVFIFQAGKGNKLPTHLLVEFFAECGYQEVSLYKELLHREGEGQG